jgi:sigma-B regulation protein RsbU (phosphoserine phosphatase)
VPARQAPGYLLFKLLLVIGGLLGLLLLYQSVRNYQFVAERLVREELAREAARHGSYILQLAREADIGAPEEAGGVLERVVEERRGQIAWIRLVNLRGDVLASAGAPAGQPFSPADLRLQFDSGDPLSRVLDTPAGRLLVALRPLRIRWGRTAQRAGSAADRPETPPPPAAPGRGSGPTLMEIALHWEGVGAEFGRLRRNMIVSASAAIALLAAMAFLGLGFRSYVRGKQLEQQLELARSVQQGFLPRDPFTPGNLDVAAACDPAWQVGGDFYDVFQAANERIALILGDVAGKGLPAALLMGLLHGAVRSNCALTDSIDLENATRRLNDLLCARTAPATFVTMFWCHYDPLAGKLCYVNAGHLPPFLVRESPDGALDLTRLEEGGPVLGVIPEASYRQGTVEFRAGDLLVLYSDGVIESVNPRGEEFEEARLRKILLRAQNRSAAAVRDEILDAVRRFAGGRPQQDDITLLIVRAGRAVVGEDAASLYAASAA